MKLFQKASIIIISFLFIFSCDTIEDNFYEDTPYTCDYTFDLPTKKVFIEDFTGYQCVNCPRAAERIHELLETYPCHVVPVAIHYGFFAEPFSAGDADYRSDVGTAIGAAFNITEALPIGMVNRIPSSGDYNTADEDWPARVVNELEKSVYADVEILCDANLSGTNLTLDIELNEINDLGINYKLVALLTEDGIIGIQKDGGTTIEDYEHNHMLRDGLIESDPVWGVDVTLPYTHTFTYSWPTEQPWVAENCNVIVYVYNTDSKEVIQVEQFDITIIQ